jgi:hypothetical protein
VLRYTSDNQKEDENTRTRQGRRRKREKEVEKEPWECKGGQMKEPHEKFFSVPEGSMDNG